MTRQNKNLADLKLLTDMTKRARQARMSALQSQISDLTGKLAHLAQKAAEATGVGPMEPAARAGAVILWRRWVEARQIAINQRIARLAAELEIERDLFRKEFGRAQVVDDLIEADARAARAKAARAAL